jgi:hypothetical protein
MNFFTRFPWRGKGVVAYTLLANGLGQFRRQIAATAV